ncbi:TetR/AcrR family transcriptional regulator [Gloeobacter kilaueensis]|uniref:TetR family transcriptional regulator n=1 Tax=Gloeobacter kilaueensis (strain ATCC BAA-2537 / CCAP 1431/1 / ULC 316 / JS1) TaxID=1183438 RepID=U5QC47_GLOK1|nr:TetR/AcrR family transcriptional regulator [Gloeobacter kilaueensis]AGY56421.1 TetR family transcriptional regulator [Gloeobacter kilaueensis JS1]
MNLNARPSRRRRKDARPAEIIEAARVVFESRGYAAARLDDIAEVAGVTKGTIFLYFDSKEALFRAVIEATQTPPLALVTGLIDNLEPPFADAFFVIARIFPQAAAQPKMDNLALLIFREAGNFPELARYFKERVADTAQALLRRLIQRGLDAGEFSCADPDYVARFAVGGLMQLMLWNRTMGQYSEDPHEVERYLAVWAQSVVALLGARGDTRDA